MHSRVIASNLENHPGVHRVVVFSQLREGVTSIELGKGTN
jgi:hypothetical protein